MDPQNYAIFESQILSIQQQMEVMRQSLQLYHAESQKRSLPNYPTDPRAPTAKRIRLPDGVDKGTQTNENHKIPIEVFDKVFTYLPREDLDRCQMVCRSWNKRINDVLHTYPRRTITLMKFYVKDNRVQISASQAHKRKEYVLDHSELKEEFELKKTFAKLLKYSFIKRWVILNVPLTDDLMDRLHSCLSQCNIEVFRVEMMALDLQKASAPGFHKFIGRTIKASQYFIEAVKGARAEHFSRGLIEQESVAKADDFTVYDVKGDSDVEITLELDDAVISENIFGNKDLPSRNSLYLDAPNLSDRFVNDILLKFVKSKLDTFSLVNHVEIAHCRTQVLNNLHRNISEEYEHEIQVEYSARNMYSEGTIEVRMTNTNEIDNFCHLTINILP